MIKHIVLLNWKSEVSSAEIERVSEEFGKLKDEIKEISAYQFGPDAGIYKGNSSYGLIAEFATEDDLKTYVNHPKHQAFLADVAGPLLESFHATQFVF